MHKDNIALNTKSLDSRYVNLGHDVVQVEFGRLLLCQEILARTTEAGLDFNRATI